MAKQNGKRKLVREGEPSQKTKTGLDIPVPTRAEFFGLLDKAASRPEKPSRSSKGKRRTSRGQ
jgi:hypothetical protein